MDQLIQEFLNESFEGLDRMDRCLVELEAHPHDDRLVDEIFRAVHTMKSTAGFLGYARLERLSHAGEHVMSGIRSGRQPLTAEAVSGLLALSDELRAMVRTIAKTGAEPAPPHPSEPPKPSEPPDPLRIRPGAELPALPTRAAVEERTLRVEVDILNRMMNLVGELVLTRNQLAQHAPVGECAETLRRLEQVTSGLRETVMHARLQPVSHVFGRLPRMVRDLALSCGKQVRLELAGQETGLDKSLLEALRDPLTHALRNAVDHGIGTPAERLAVGKPSEGTIRLSACHVNGSVVLEISDDGQGVRLDQVRAKAIERGLATPEQAAAMSDSDALPMIFLPGFSTARDVTRVSGRGVGMDVVKSNVERVGGRVEMESHQGVGSVLRLRVPLTVAIVPALVVATCGETFCLPQNALAELVYVRRTDAAHMIERIGTALLLRLRESLLPIVSLDRLLDIEDLHRTREPHGFYVAVLEAEGRRFGLTLDRLVASEEIVVKPLTSGLREIPLFSGATVLGNGGLAMILDVTALAARAGAQTMLPEAGEAAPPSGPHHAPRFVVYESRLRGRAPERVAMPLEDVERIATVPLRQVEYADGSAWLRHEGALLELEDAAGMLRDLTGSNPEPAKQQPAHQHIAHQHAEHQNTGQQETDPLDTQLTVLICARPGADHRTGLIVRRVLDVAAGLELPGRLTIVNDALTALHSVPLPRAAMPRELSCPPIAWQEVA